MEHEHLNPDEQIVPAEDAAEITADDANDLPNPTRGIYVGAGGDLKVDMLAGETVTFTGLVAGQVYPLRIRRVYATGTTAGSLVALY